MFKFLKVLLIVTYFTIATAAGFIFVTFLIHVHEAALCVAFVCFVISTTYFLYEMFFGYDGFMRKLEKKFKK